MALGYACETIFEYADHQGQDQRPRRNHRRTRNAGVTWRMIGWAHGLGAIHQHALTSEVLTIAE
jgi:hypothetical protein